MNVSGVSRSGYTPLPVFQDMAVVLAARTAVAQMSAQAAAQVSATADETATQSAAVTGGSVDVYL
jgi:hypothetical protein